MDNQQFELLLIKELTGVLSSAERQELQAFLQGDAIRRQEYQLLKDYWTNKGAAVPDVSAAFGKVRDKIRLLEEGFAGETPGGAENAKGPIGPDTSTKEDDTVNSAEYRVGIRETAPGPYRVSVPTGATAQPAGVERIAESADRGREEAAEEMEAVARDGAVRRRGWKWVWRAAAAVLCVGLGAYGWGRLSDHKDDVAQWQEKYAAKRTRSQLILSDGSTVLLNSDSHLRFPPSFDGHTTREVFLDGEAFFDVSKDPDHPFIIHTGKMDVRVLGTAFNVKSYSNDPQKEATLIRGSIEVTFTDRPSDRIILKPKDKLVLGGAIGHTDVTIAPLRDTRPEAADKYKLTELTYYRPHDSTVVETSWTENKLAFRQEEFQNLARRMERWYGVTIVFDNKALERITFSGLFEKETIEEALHALQLSEKFGYRSEGSTIHIY